MTELCITGTYNQITYLLLLLDQAEWWAGGYQKKPAPILQQTLGMMAECKAGYQQFKHTQSIVLNSCTL